MLGNRLGWTISAAIVVAVTLMLVMLNILAGRKYTADQQKKREEQQVQNVAAKYMTNVGKFATEWKVQLATNPRELAKAWMTREGSPIEKYQEALAAYNQRPETFDFKPSDLAKMPPTYRDQINRAMKPLIEASRLTGSGVLRNRWQELVGYDVASDTVACDLTALRAMRRLGHVATTLAMADYYSPISPTATDAKALVWELHQARFTLGMKMLEERICAREAIAGLQLLSVALTMSEHAPDAVTGLAFARFESDRKDYANTELRNIWAAGMWTIDPNVYDMIALATRCQDTMWRVEAILTLGRAKYRCKPDETNAMQKQGMEEAARTIKSLLADSDPHVRAAAEKADKLSIEEFRKMDFETFNPFEF